MLAWHLRNETQSMEKLHLLWNVHPSKVNGGALMGPISPQKLLFHIVLRWKNVPTLKKTNQKVIIYLCMKSADNQVYTELGFRVLKCDSCWLQQIFGAG